MSRYWGGVTLWGGEGVYALRGSVCVSARGRSLLMKQRVVGVTLWERLLFQALCGVASVSVSARGRSEVVAAVAGQAFASAALEALRRTDYYYAMRP